MKKYFMLLSLILFNWLLAQEEFTYFQISLASKVEISPNVSFVIMSPKGLRTGYNIITEKSYDEIPGGRYGDEDLGDDLLEKTEITDRIRDVFFTTNPEEGQYIVSIFAYDDDVYDFYVHIARGMENVSRYNFSGEIRAGQEIRYGITYTADPSVPITVEEIKALDPLSTIDEMIGFIDTAYANKKIDLRGIATSLISKLEVAKKELEKEKPKQAVNALNAFLNELEAQHEKHIAEEVYLYLKEKVEAVIKQIESSG